MSNKNANDIVFVSAKRTPFGAFNGKLKSLSATDLAVEASKATLASANISAESIDQVIFGNVLQTSTDAIYLARHVGLRSGLPQKVPALTVNRLCGSGFEAVVLGAKELKLGEAQAVLVGGTESMSQAPHIVRGMRDGAAFGRPPELEDSLWSCLTDSYTGFPMGITAENLAQQYEISREDCDQYALRSQEAWAAADARGAFSAELCSVDIKSRRGSTTVTQDEHPRASSIEGLTKLRPAFKKDGVVTGGNASGICDGASAMVLSTRAFAESQSWPILGKLISYGVSGCDPNIMGIGPVPAAKIALARAQMEVSEMNLVEVNEAFAPQYIAVEKALGLNREITNVNGGAISLGHPLGASGARITAHLLYALAERGERLALGSACIGGGQGIAVIVEAE
ncbi:MAG: acetyl-CoA C-acyltransferase [Myxococcales bacterium]|nr:acetyl-CoA C-acyltransferase [Myxococcales bacterium]